MSKNIHVLIVEDEAPKCGHIVNLLGSASKTLSYSIARSVASALEQLEAQNVDLLLLDMSLPTFDIGEREGGGRPQGFGGLEILRFMVMSETCCPTVVITGYEGFTRDSGGTVDLVQLKGELFEEFPLFLKDVLHYNSTLDKWRTTLSTVLSEILAGDCAE